MYKFTISPHLHLIETRETVIIDPVLDYDAFAGTVKADTAKKIMAYVKKNELDVTRIIDTHVHAVSLCIGIEMLNARYSLLTALYRTA